MSIYTEGDILQGQGALEQALRAQSTIPGRSSRMSAGVAIGILSAAIRSGLPGSAIDRLIDQDFGHSEVLLKRMLSRHEGNDWDDVGHAGATDWRVS